MSRRLTRRISVRPALATTVASGPVMITVLVSPIIVGRMTVEFR
jgi:hypothetical protein